MTAARLQSPAPLREETLARFAGLLEQRLGHGSMLRRSAALERRLRDLMQVAGGHSDPERFVEELSAAREGSPLSCALRDIGPNQETWLFRDAPQLSAAVRLLEDAPRDARLRVLCAGCATGEEAYSVAAYVEASAGLRGREVEILGIDVSPAAVTFARTGRYGRRSLERAEQGPPGWKELLFRAGGDGAADLEIRPAMRERVRFVEANLVNARELAGFGQFDLVLCRNVLIYFEGAPLARVAASLAALVREGGALVLGRAETGAVAPDGLEAHPIGDGRWAFFKEAAR